MAKINLKDALAAVKTLEKTDPWALRRIGREASLPAWRELIATSKKPAVRAHMEKALAVELEIIAACRRQDQVAWDRLNAEMKQLTQQVRELA